MLPPVFYYLVSKSILSVSLSLYTMYPFRSQAAPSITVNQHFFLITVDKHAAACNHSMVRLRNILDQVLVLRAHLLSQSVPCGC